MSDRTAMSISLPDAMQEWVEARLLSGQFGSASEYIRHLVRQDQHDQAVRALEERLVKGIPEDEAPQALSAETWRRSATSALDRLEDRRGKRAG